MSRKKIAPGSDLGRRTEHTDTVCSAPSIPQTFTHVKPPMTTGVDLLLSFKHLDSLATQAKKRGDYGAFWRLRRAALLRQAAWYERARADREVAE